jgi:hypothetical protein
MRNFRSFQAPATTESPTLTVEEQAILEDEHNEATANLDEAQTGIERVTDVNTVSGDVDQVISTMPQVTEVEQDLINSVNDMVVAGTDAESDVLTETPSPETGVIAIESIVEKGVEALKKLWKAIVLAVKNLIVGVKHWFTTYFSKLDGQVKRAGELRKRLHALLNADGEVDDQVAIADILGYSGGSHFGALLAFLKVFEKSVVGMQQLPQFIFSHHDNMKKIGEQLVTLFDSVYQGSNEAHGLGGDNDRTGKAGLALFKAMQDYLKQFGDVYDDRNNKTKGLSIVRKSIGNTDILVRNPVLPKAAAGNNTFSNVDAHNDWDAIKRLSEVRFDVKKAGSEFDTVMEIKLPVKGKVSEVAKEIDDALAKYETVGKAFIHLRDGAMKDMTQLIEKVEAACDKMVERASTKLMDNDGSARRFTALMPAYTNWATQPGTKLCQEVARHLNFWATLYEKATNVLEGHGSKADNPEAAGKAPAGAPKLAAA